MSDTLRDQLLSLGFKPSPKAKPERPSAGERRQGGKSPHPHKGQQARGQGGRAPKATNRTETQAGAGAPKPRRDGGEMDLAKAYALRAQREQQERAQAQRAKEEEARRRREARARLAELLKGRTLNDPEAEIARHFPYGGKIKRIYVNAGQLRALNAGELGVLQQDGRYLLVDAATLAEAEAIFPPCVALKVDPHAPAEEDPYADPKYQVPDDLVW